MVGVTMMERSRFTLRTESEGHMKAIPLVVLLLLTSAASQESPPKHANAVIFEHVNVLSTETGHVQKNVTVVIRDGRISQIVSKAPHQAGATLIDGRGGLGRPWSAEYPSMQRCSSAVFFDRLPCPGPIARIVFPAVRYAD